MKPGSSSNGGSVVVDEMFPDGQYDGDEASVGTSSSSVQLMDITATEKAAHSDFYNKQFGDLLDDEDLN